MASYISSLPFLRDFFPPSPAAWKLVQTIFMTIPIATLIQWTPLKRNPAMGRTSSSSTNMFLNLPGRLAWSVAESVGPLNLIYILYTLPRRLDLPTLVDSKSSATLSPTDITSMTRGLLGTGLPLTHEIMGALYVVHYINRTLITPWFGAPAMSPIHVSIASMMALFQYLNSTSLGGWLCYSAQELQTEAMRTGVSSPYTSNPTSKSPFAFTSTSALTLLGLTLFIAGLSGNITAEWTLFSLRRAAAKRKAKSEGRATVLYDKVYVIPEPKGLFKYVLYPHYSLEWVEWTGYWLLGASWGLGWTWTGSAAAMFLVNELATMTPRACEGVAWYEKRFGKRPVAGRRAVVPGLL